MNIEKATIGYMTVIVDGATYFRFGPNQWFLKVGDVANPVYDDDDYEKAFQKFLETDKPPSTRGKIWSLDQGKTCSP